MIVAHACTFHWNEWHPTSEKQLLGEAGHAAHRSATIQRGRASEGAGWPRHLRACTATAAYRRQPAGPRPPPTLHLLCNELPGGMSLQPAQRRHRPTQGRVAACRARRERAASGRGGGPADAALPRRTRASGARPHCPPPAVRRGDPGCGSPARPTPPSSRTRVCGGLPCAL